ncbi:acetyl-CoA C-acyltransferase [Aerococcaceae bacterium NML191219]|nr:acetyl-CoA C-acyltransferase [Aerococcaceae bacterium NML191219]
MQKVYITAINRTPIGKFLGSLSDVSPSDLASGLLTKMLATSNIPVSAIDEVIIGNVLSAGHGQNIARQVALKAGLSESVPAYTLNMVCGSGLKAVYEAFIKIKYGMNRAIIAGGVENMSQAAYLAPTSMRKGFKLGDVTFVDSLLKDGLTDAVGGYHMGQTAENLVSQYRISRQEQDEYALASQLKARQAQQSGAFKAEILSVVQMMRKGERVTDEDEYINYTTDAEQLANLRPAFIKNGSVTAGNSSGINDGAALLCLVSEATLHEFNLTPLAEIVGFAQSGVAPEVMGMGPVDAVANVLAQNHLTFEDVAVFELNEAFAAQAIAVERALAERLAVTPEALRRKTNPKGGAIALGHPIGASGARILTTLVHELQEQLPAYGVASLCIGGGMGIAALIKVV